MQADLALREGADTQELKKSLRQIGLSSIRATHTVNQLLALARAEASGNTVTHVPCDLVSLCTEVIQDSVPRALDKHIDLGFEGPPDGSNTRLEGNPTLLKEMVRNLIDNAINYTPSSSASPGVVTVRVLAATQASGSQALQVQVEDSGPGIPLHERELVLEPFYRALGTLTDGSGLGLSIVKEIVEQHRAHLVIADAHPGHSPPGARFSIIFANRRHAS